ATAPTPRLGTTCGRALTTSTAGLDDETPTSRAFVSGAFPSFQRLSWIFTSSQLSGTLSWSPLSDTTDALPGWPVTLAPATGAAATQAPVCVGHVRMR